MGNAHKPGKKFALLMVSSVIEGFEGFQKDRLEDVIGQLPIAHHLLNVGINAVFVPQYQKFKSALFAAKVSANEILIAYTDHGRFH
jgi:hypothetical protein